MKYHITKSGEKIKIEDLETIHLENIIKRIDLLAKKGIDIFYGGGAFGEEMWFDTEIVYGEEVRINLNYYTYKNELDKRILPTKIQSNRTNESRRTN